MAQLRNTIVDRVSSICAGAPFKLKRAKDPFSFGLQPAGEIDQVFRIDVEAQDTIGKMSFGEERTDRLTVWIARKQQADPTATRARLITDVTSLTAAVTRDGTAGDFAILDEGGGVAFSHESGEEFAVARLTLPVNYEAQL